MVWSKQRKNGNRNWILQREKKKTSQDERDRRWCWIDEKSIKPTLMMLYMRFHSLLEELFFYWLIIFHRRVRKTRPQRNSQFLFLNIEKPVSDTISLRKRKPRRFFFLDLWLLVEGSKDIFRRWRKERVMGEECKESSLFQFVKNLSNKTWKKLLFMDSSDYRTFSSK